MLLTYNSSHFLSSLCYEIFEVIFKSFIDFFHNFKCKCLYVYISWSSDLKWYVLTPPWLIWGTSSPAGPAPPVLPCSFGNICSLFCHFNKISHQIISWFKNPPLVLRHSGQVDSHFFKSISSYDLAYCYLDLDFLKQTSFLSNSNGLFLLEMNK